VPAVVLSSFIWGFAHSNYPNQPYFIRGIEVGMSGLLVSVVMLRWGILAALVWHYTVDAFYTALLLLRSGSPYFVVSGSITTWFASRLSLEPHSKRSCSTCTTIILLPRRLRLRRRIRDLCGWLQARRHQEPIHYGAQDFEWQRRDLRQFDASCGGIGHPPRDLEIDAVRSTHGDGEVGVPGCGHHVQLFTGKRVEAVVNRDLRRQGIVTYC